MYSESDEMKWSFPVKGAASIFDCTVRKDMRKCKASRFLPRHQTEQATAVLTTVGVKQRSGL